MTTTLRRHGDLAVFGLVAFTLPWLLWTLRVPAGLMAAGGMAAVGLATFVATRFPGRTQEWRRETGLQPFLPLRSTVGQVAVGLGLMVVIGSAAQILGGLASAPPLDLVGLSGARFAYGDTGPAVAMLAGALVKVLLLFVVLLPLAFCEEWGWRGLLLPRLMPLGVVPAMIISGLVWGLWHLPAYLGPEARTGLLPFLIWCILFGAVLGWLRMRSGNVWAATAAHAAHNTVIIGFVNVAVTDASALRQVNPWAHGFNGWPGWLVMAIVLIAVVVRQRPRRTRQAFADSAPQPVPVSTQQPG